MAAGGWLVHCINPDCSMSTARLMDRLLMRVSQHVNALLLMIFFKIIGSPGSHFVASVVIFLFFYMLNT